MQMNSDLKHTITGPDEARNTVAKIEVYFEVHFCSLFFIKSLLL